MFTGYRINTDNLPEPFVEQHFIETSSDTSEENNGVDNGFASRFDPDFSQMKPHEIRKWVREHNYAPAAVTNEVFNSASHLIGGILFLVGIVAIVFQSRSVTHLISFIIYGFSIGVMLFGSALYHGVGLHWGISIKIYRYLRLLDHEGIFFAISGSFTPFALITVSGALGVTITVYMYFVMICGVTMKFILRHTINQNVFNFLYLVMGWSAALVVTSIQKKCGWIAIIWVVAGGLAYTIGIIFFIRQKPNPIPGFFCSHEIWHIFVLLGVACHFIAHFVYTKDLEIN